jgi:hypothetical protein
LVVVHEPLEDMAEHAGIDGVVVAGLLRFDEAVALEEVADEVAQRLVGEVERRVALLERGGRKEAAVEVGDVAEAEGLRAVVRCEVEGTEEEGLEPGAEEVAVVRVEELRGEEAGVVVEPPFALDEVEEHEPAAEGERERFAVVCGLCGQSGEGG